MSTQVEDLKFYLSGAVEHEALQNSPMRSLGGYRSSVLLPNGRLDNLFDEVGIYEAQNGSEVFRCLFLKNESGDNSAMTDLSLHITGKQDFEKIKFGVSQPPAADGRVQMLDSQSDMPYNVTFYEAYSEEEKVVLINNLGAGQVLALWLMRELSPTSETNIKNQISLVFNWT